MNRRDGHLQTLTAVLNASRNQHTDQIELSVDECGEVGLGFFFCFALEKSKIVL